MRVCTHTHTQRFCFSGESQLIQLVWFPKSSWHTACSQWILVLFPFPRDLQPLHPTGKQMTVQSIKTHPLSQYNPEEFEKMNEIISFEHHNLRHKTSAPCLKVIISFSTKHSWKDFRVHLIPKLQGVGLRTTNSYSWFCFGGFLFCFLCLFFTHASFLLFF